MSAALLREAAAILRERAEVPYGSPWVADDAHVFTAVDDDPDDGPTIYVNGGVYANQRRTATYIATVQPSVGLALAAGLDDHAHDHDCYECGWHVCEFIKVAHLIVGGES